MLHEYANKEWNGILKDLYLQRWLKFFEYAENKMNGKFVTYPDLFAIEKQWAAQNNSYTTAPEGNSITLLPEIIKQVMITGKSDDGKMIDFFKHPKNR